MSKSINDLVDQLRQESNLPDAALLELLAAPGDCQYLHDSANSVRQEIYGSAVYLRGLIEFTNYCHNDCYYCGLRRSNRQAQRYRLSSEDILACCATGHRLGYRTFVLQGGEDGYFSDERLVPLVAKIKELYPECAVTLSVGERSKDSYRKLREAGADRYLLRHETANRSHYEKLHPQEMSWENRRRCLFELKELGYQVGAGLMVGSPFQEDRHLLEDLRFMQELKPDMIGIGPYLRQADTPFAGYPNGSMSKTLRLLSIVRLMFPYILLPATTALGTLNPRGRELGLRAGANVLMPNLSPLSVRRYYNIYDNKICTGEEAAECLTCLSARIKHAGFTVSKGRGDVKRTH
ncbi:MAG: [FeFe] hydrogenase H-cluster radical SAM maturase HydE [bacterium]|nr:[FeFe] hydrogenase H-cluster radical SAM maturase HydE [bacterium]